jgi:glutathione reductase (NADPH)
MRTFDVFVIGTGVSGTAIANACAQSGLKVGITDDRVYGGTCALRGCVPKKVLFGATEVVESASRLLGNGIEKIPAINWDSLMVFKNSFVGPKPKNKEQNFKENGIETFHGGAKFISGNQLKIDDEIIEASKIVIATGAKPRDLNIPGSGLAITSDDFLELKNLPKTMLFIGGGYIAFEFAHIAARCGVKVTIVNNGPNVLHNFETEIVQHLVEATEEMGVEIVTETEVTEIQKNDAGFTVVGQQKGETAKFKTALVVNSSGRVPNIEELDLEKGNVKFSEKGVEVNEYLQSVSNPNVYAAGDVSATKGLPLTPLATAEAKTVISNILHGNKQKVDYSVMPTVVFTLPALAAVGLTEQQALYNKLSFEAHYNSVPEWFSAKQKNAKYYAYKIIVEKNSRKILGAHLLGAHAEETINLFALAIKTGITVDELASIPFAFPTSGADVPSMLF